MTPIVQIEHSLPGRTRLRIPGKRGDLQYFNAVRDSLSQCGEIERIAVNGETGSILVHHRGHLDAVIEHASRMRLFDAADGEGERSTLPSLARPMPLVAAGFASLGVVQLVRGQTVGSAVESFWSSYHAGRMNSPWLAALLFAAGLHQLAFGQLLGSASSLMFYAATAERLSNEQSDRAP